MPFCDFGAVTDPPSADVTAHVRRDARRRGPRRRAGSAARARLAPAPAGARRLLVRPLGRELRLRHRRRPAGARRLRPRGPRERPAAVDWLEAVQNPDGGFGEDLRSYRDPSWSGRGVSTASQTAWALVALHAAGADESEAATRAVSWLVETQRPDGGWDEPFYTGTGFPGDFYLNYHLYRDVFPVMALGRFVRERSHG